QSFFGTIPWTTISYWMITYMGVERKLAPDLISIIMLLWILFMVIGNIVSGYINDILFKKTLRGRVILGTIVVFLSAIFLYLTIYSISFEFFIIFGTITAFTIPMAGPSVNASILDVTEPELRGSATAYSNFFGGLGSSLGPFLASIIATFASLGFAIAFIGSITWIICGIFFTVLIFIIPRDIIYLKNILVQRSNELTFKK
ncbi:MAG: MFS transporter, partial [Thermoplasmata archaeon]